MSRLRIDTELVRDLCDLMEEKGLTEVEITLRGDSLRLSRMASGAVAISTAAPTTGAGTDQSAPQEGAAPSAEPHAGTVTAPMVGTAYLSSEPGAARFVNVGDTVTEGQTLLIIEAMKTMNPVAAPRAGKVIEILVENEQPVEFGQGLIVIE